MSTESYRQNMEATCLHWASLVAQLVKDLLWCRRLGCDPWVSKIPWRRERLPTPLFWPGEFHGQSMKSQRVRHNWATFTFTFLIKDQMRTSSLTQWHHQLDGHEFEQILGDGEGQGSLMCFSPWGRKESGTTEQQMRAFRKACSKGKTNNLTLLLRLQILTHESFKRT